MSQSVLPGQADAADEPAQAPEAAYKFDAFISYSHAADGRLAPTLHSGLERLARPWYRLRALHVFRDTTNLAIRPDLWGEIVRHLEQSRWLLLLASPQAAASKWVAKELSWWLEHRSADRILVVLTEGEIVWDEAAADFDWHRTTALPQLLSGCFLSEPHHGDFAWVRQQHDATLDSARFRDAVLGVASTLRGVPKDELDGEAVRTLRRNRAMAWGAATALLLLLALALVNLSASREAAWHTSEALANSQRTLANALAAEAAQTRAAGDGPAALRLLAEALQTAPTPQVRANVLLAPPPAARLAHILAPALATRCLAFAPGGRTLALGLFDGNVVLVDAIDGLELGRVQAVAMPVIGLAFSGDGQRLYAVQREPADAAWNEPLDGQPRSALSVFDLKRPGAPQLLQQHTRAGKVEHYAAVAFDAAHDQVWVASGPALQTVDARGDKPTTALRHADGRPFATLSLSPDGRYVAGSDTHGHIEILDLQTKTRYAHSSPQPRTTFAYSDYRVSIDPRGPGGPVAVFGAPDGRVYAWHFGEHTSPKALALSHAGGTSVALMSADERWLASGGWDGIARLSALPGACTQPPCDAAASASRPAEAAPGGIVDGPPRSARLPLLSGTTTAGVGAIAFAPDSSLLAATQVVPVGSVADGPGRWMFGRVHLWRIESREASLLRASRANPPIVAMDYDGQGRLLTLTGARNPVLNIDGAPTRLTIPGIVMTPASISQIEDTTTSELAFLSDAGRFGDQEVRDPRILTGELILGCAMSRRAASIACVSAESAPSERALRKPVLHMAAPGDAQTRRIELPLPRVTGLPALAWSDDGSHLALSLETPLPTEAGSLSRRPTHVFTLQRDGSAMKEIDGERTLVARGLAWRPGSAQLALADDTGSVVLLGPDGRNTWNADDRMVTDRALLAWTADGRCIVAASQARLRSWCWQEGAWQLHTADVGVGFHPTALAMLADGVSVAVGERSGRIAVHDSRSWAQLAGAEGEAGAVLQLRVRPDGGALAVLAQREAAVLGAAVPASAAAAERLTNWTLAAGKLGNVSEARRQVLDAQTADAAFSFDPAAMAYWDIVAQGDALTKRSMGPVDWIIGRHPVDYASDLRAWLEAHPRHTLVRALDVSAGSGEAAR